MSRATNIIISIDQLFNVLLAGDPDETLSARAYRSRNYKVRWYWAWTFIDCLFFWQTGHCESAYRNEVARRHMPESYRLNK